MYLQTDFLADNVIRQSLPGHKSPDRTLGRLRGPCVASAVEVDSAIEARVEPLEGVLGIKHII